LLIYRLPHYITLTAAPKQHAWTAVPVTHVTGNLKTAGFTDISAYCEGCRPPSSLNFQGFLKDEKTKNAVVWKIQVIGKATKDIPETVRDEHYAASVEVYCQDRDKITHSCFGIDYGIVWRVATEKLTEITPEIEKMLKALSGQRQSEKMMHKVDGNMNRKELISVGLLWS